MAPPTKSRPKVSVKAGKAPTGAQRDARAKADADMGATIVKRRDNGDKYAVIASDLGITVGKAIFLYECATVAPKDKIKFTSETLGAKIDEARDEGLSWGRISARTGVPEGRVRSTWEKHTGKSARGESIGKGGRKANGVVAKPKASAKPKATPKTTAVKPKAAAKPATPVIRRKIKRRVAAS